MTFPGLHGKSKKVNVFGSGPMAMGPWAQRALGWKTRGPWALPYEPLGPLYGGAVGPIYPLLWPYYPLVWR